MSRALRKRDRYEPSAAELKDAWDSRNVLGVDGSVEKMNELLNKFAEDELSSPEVSPMRHGSQGSGVKMRKRKEYRDWSAASVFDAQSTDKMQKSPPLLQSAQSPFQPYVPRNSEQPARDKYKVSDIPKFNQRKVSTKQSMNANSLEKFSPKQLQRTLNMRVGKDIPEQVIRRAIKDILHRNSRDVTVRSLRLQLQIALGADFTGCDNIISRLVDEINGVRNGTDDAFLKELKALKKAREAKKLESSESKGNLEKKQKPSTKHVEKQEILKHNENQKTSHVHKNTAPKQPSFSHELDVKSRKDSTPKITTSMPDFEMRRKLGLLTNSEKQKLKEQAAIVIQCLARMFLAKCEINKRKQLQILQQRANKLRREKAAIAIQSCIRGKLQRMKYLECQNTKRQHEIKRRKACLVLQKYYRGRLGREYFKAYKLKLSQAAQSVQSGIRGHLARRAYRVKQQQRQTAAVAIQASVSAIKDIHSFYSVSNTYTRTIQFFLTDAKTHANATLQVMP